MTAKKMQVVSLSAVRAASEAEHKKTVERLQSQIQALLQSNHDYQQALARTEVEKQRLYIEHQSMLKDLHLARMRLNALSNRFTALPGWCIRVVERFWPLPKIES